jgi:hypothetical protein
MPRLEEVLRFKVSIRSSLLSSHTFPSYQFSQVELPLLRQQIFPSFMSTMTVLRHPIERVLSSYRMIRNTFLHEQDWTMKDWLLHTAMSSPPQEQSSGRKLIKQGHTKSAPFPRDGVFNPRKHHTQANSSFPPPNQKNFSSLPKLPPKVRVLPTDKLDENYMTKWLCGMWSASPATEECYERAFSNLNKFDFVFLTQSLSSDLPIAARLLGLNTSEETEHVSSLLLSRPHPLSLTFLPFRSPRTTFACTILCCRARAI